MRVKERGLQPREMGMLTRRIVKATHVRTTTGGTGSLMSPRAPVNAAPQRAIAATVALGMTRTYIAAAARGTRRKARATKPIEAPATAPCHPPRRAARVIVGSMTRAVEQRMAVHRRLRAVPAAMRSAVSCGVIMSSFFGSACLTERASRTMVASSMSLSAGMLIENPGSACMSGADRPNKPASSSSILTPRMRNARPPTETMRPSAAQSPATRAVATSLRPRHAHRIAARIPAAAKALTSA